MKVWIAIALGAVASLAQAQTPQPCGAFIEGASVVDGTGAPARKADVRLEGERIAAIGELDARPCEEVIDGRGFALAPGFIDTHSHHDEELREQPAAISAVSQGITTIIAGQDGRSKFPLSAFFADFEAKPTALNIASYSGHNTLRTRAMGADFKRQATTAEVESMRELLRQDMDAGAIGLSTGLEYDPGIYSSTGEVLALAREASAKGGRYISHMRSEDREIWKALDEIVAIGRATGMPVQVSHMKLAMVDWWGQADRFLSVLDRARAEGVKVTGDIYPYEYWQSYLTVLLPDRDFENRASVEFVLKSLAPADGLRISSFKPDPSIVGKTVAEIAKLRRLDPAATVMALIRESEAAGEPVTVIGTSMQSKDVAKLIAWKHANICTDGSLTWRHPRGAGAMTKVLRQYVREEKLLTLEAAVHKMSGLSAEHVGIKDRGVIRGGAYADLVLFSPAAVADRATLEQPHAVSEGIEKVWVNGRVVFAKGKATGEFPGRVIRRSP